VSLLLQGFLEDIQEIRNNKLAKYLKMGVRKRNKAEEVKAEKKQQYFAKLKNCPTSPRKMRLVADMVRGVKVDRALQILKHSSKDAASSVEKLLLSAISNWQSKNEGVRIEDSNLYVKEIFVDSGRMLKRIMPAPQGRAHRIHKHSNHITLYVDSKIVEEVEAEPVVEKVEVKETKTRKKTNKL
jgi:large subunit ribosomal protein L22